MRASPRFPDGPTLRSAAAASLLSLLTPGCHEAEIMACRWCRRCRGRCFEATQLIRILMQWKHRAVVLFLFAFWFPLSVLCTIEELTSKTLIKSLRIWDLRKFHRACSTLKREPTNIESFVLFRQCKRVTVIWPRHYLLTSKCVRKLPCWLWSWSRRSQLLFFLLTNCWGGH